MDSEFKDLLEQYPDVADDEPIPYLGSNGERNEERDERLRDVSKAIQSRSNPHITLDELIGIGVWKTGGSRLEHYLERNSEDEVKRLSSQAFARDTAVEDRIEYLRKLIGVSVPMASSILTVFDPSHFAVIDYRAIRALGWVKPELGERDSYESYTTFLNWIRDYQRSPQIYAEYLEAVSKIAADQNLTPREVDMVLWTLDKTELAET